MLTRDPLQRPTPAPPRGALASRDLRLGALVLLICAGISLPTLGSFGMFDPWETHYTEVARQLLERGDWLSPHWHNGVGPEGQSETDFWSKPVGSMWLSGLSLTLLGHADEITLRGAGRRDPGELLTGGRVEWAVRLPFFLCGLCGVLGVFAMCAGLFNRRVALLAALILATAPLYFMVSRQAMTDMPYVGLMTGGLSLFALAVFGERRPVRRREVRLGRLGLSWPDHPLFYLFVLVFALVMILQLRELVTQLLRVPLPQRIGSRQLSAAVWMAPYGAAALSALWLASRARTHGGLYLHWFYLAVGVAGLSKGLIGALQPGYIVLLYLLVSRQWRLLADVALGRGLLIFACVAFPWYHAMLLRHGRPFWNQLFGVEQLRRLTIGEQAQARGTWEYYLQQLGYALFPWVALLPAALARALRPAPGPAGGAERARSFCLVWFVGAMLLFTLSTTKYNYYFLPAIPPAAILVALLLDDLLAGRVGRARLALGAAVLIVGLTAADLIRQPARWVWMFTYLSDSNWAQGAPGGLPLIAYAASCAALIALLLVRRLRRAAVVLLVSVCVVLGGCVLSWYQLGCARHWSQKRVLQTYYRLRRDRSEPLVAWRFNWRGETWYTAAQVVVSLKDDGRIRSWLAERTGRAVFFITERRTYTGIAAIIPTQRGRQTLRIVDGSNVHVVLARAEL